MKWEMRKNDQLEFQKARVFCQDGTMYTGRGDCVCDVSNGTGEEIEGILFLTDKGEYITLREDEIERIEILD